MEGRGRCRGLSGTINIWQRGKGLIELLHKVIQEMNKDILRNYMETIRYV